MKLASARIVTNDVPRSARFYEEITRIAPVGSDDYVEIRTPGATLAISSQRSMDVFGAGATTPGANRALIIDFEVDDVDEERARLQGVIPECVLEPTTQPWGNRSMLFYDPDGNLINFFMRVRRTTGSRGANGACVRNETQQEDHR